MGGVRGLVVVVNNKVGSLSTGNDYLGSDALRNTVDIIYDTRDIIMCT